MCLQATWSNVREAAAGLRLQQPLALADCQLMATLCPELVSVQQHHRWAGLILESCPCRQPVATDMPHPG
jgi:hypothetical protein